MRLHVGVGRAEEFLRAVDGELLGDIDILAAAVIALARIAFRVFVGQYRALRLEHARARVILGSDELDVIFLAAPLALERAAELGVEAADIQALWKHSRTLQCKSGG